MEEKNALGTILSGKEDVAFIDGHPVKVVEYSDSPDVDGSDYCAECMIKFPEDKRIDDVII